MIVFLLLLCAVASRAAVVQVPVSGGSGSEDGAGVSKWINCTYETPDVIDCEGNEYFDEGRDEPLSFAMWMDLFISASLVVFAGMMSGLTLGLLSLDPVMLRIVAQANGTPEEVKRSRRARKILPLLRRKHLLLVTLLISNAGAMEALPIFLDRVVGAVAAVLISVSMVLLFGEVLPQAICTRYGLAIGATLSPVVWFLMIVLFPLGYPLASMLDCMLGTDHNTLYRRAELKELIGMHALEEQSEDSDDDARQRVRQLRDEIARLERLGLRQQYAVESDVDVLSGSDDEHIPRIRGNGGSAGGAEKQRSTNGKPARKRHKTHESAITPEEARIIRGVLDMNHRTVYDVMTPLAQLYSLPADVVLDADTLQQLREQAFSRVPVRKVGGGFAGVLLIHTLVGVAPGPQADAALANIMPLSSLPSDTSLHDALSALKRGNLGHMALVCDRADADCVLGVLTLEDILEMMLQTEIYDETEHGVLETDRSVPLNQRKKPIALRKRQPHSRNPHRGGSSPFVALLDPDDFEVVEQEHDVV